MSALKGKAEVSRGRFDFRVWTRNGPRAAGAEVQKSRIMHRTVANSFARGEELNQQLYAGYDTREDPDLEILPYGGNRCRFWRVPLRGRRGGVREPVHAGGRRCLSAGTLRPDVHGAAQRVDPVNARTRIFPRPSGGVSHAELGSRFRQATQPTTIDSVATTSGATPCPYSPWRVTVASAANITAQPSAAPHSRVRACASRTAVVSSSDPVTKWNQCGYPHRRYSS